MLEAALQPIKGKIEDKQAFMKAVRAIEGRRPAAARCRFDEYGNVVGNVYIRKVERKDGRLVNRVIHTYPNVSQFWTYKPEEFLQEPGVLAGLSAGEEPGVTASSGARTLLRGCIQTLNSLALGGLLFLLAAGFSLIFGLMRIANLTHGALFMLGAYIGVSDPQGGAEPLARRAARRAGGRRVRRLSSNGSSCASWAATCSARCWSRSASPSSSPTSA